MNKKTREVSYEQTTLDQHEGNRPLIQPEGLQGLNPVITYSRSEEGTLAAAGACEAKCVQALVIRADVSRDADYWAPVDATAALTEIASPQTIAHRVSDLIIRGDLTTGKALLVDGGASLGPAPRCLGKSE